jgi:hypothetical protein
MSADVFIHTKIGKLAEIIRLRCVFGVCGFLGGGKK